MANQQTMKIIKKIANWLGKNYRSVAVGLLIATVLFQGNQLHKQDKEIERITGNLRAYEQLADTSQAQNRVLRLTVEELRSSKDSLLLEVKSAQKRLKISEKAISQAAVINTTVKDSVQVIIKPEIKDFKEELKLNELTTITVLRQDSILQAKLDLRNQQILFIEEVKEYKNRYRNGWCRFWHFDWKRIKTKKYQIVNSNDIINVTDTRVVEMCK